MAKKHPDSEKAEGGMRDNEAREMRVGAPQAAGRKYSRGKVRRASRKGENR